MDKVTYSIICSEGAINSKYNAKECLQFIMKIIGGNSGGKDYFAQGGGVNISLTNLERLIKLYITLKRLHESN